MHALLALMREREVEAVAVEVSAQALSPPPRRRHPSSTSPASRTSATTTSTTTPTWRSTSRRSSPCSGPTARRRGVICLDSASGAIVVAAPPRSPSSPSARPRSPPTPRPRHAPTGSSRSTRSAQRGTDVHADRPRRRTLTTTVPVIGPHMAANAALAIVMLLEGGYAWDRSSPRSTATAASTRYLPGRTQLVSGEHGPAVFVDFGHSPDAFEKTLAAVRRVTPGHGADAVRRRRRPRRHASATTWPARPSRAATSSSSPTTTRGSRTRIRSARPSSRARARRARTPRSTSTRRPRRAIVAAVGLVGEGDAILWAGPGHQDYRDIRGVRTPYSARELARRALRDAGWPVPDSRWPVPYPDERLDPTRRRPSRPLRTDGRSGSRRSADRPSRAPRPRPRRATRP